MEIEEIKQKRKDNLALFNNVILKDLLSFFEKVLEEKCKEKIEKILTQIYKDYMYGMDEIIIDLNNIQAEIFPKKNKFEWVEYIRTIVLENSKKLNYTLTYNEDENCWYITSENLKIKCNQITQYIYDEISISIIHSLQKDFAEEMFIKYHDKKIHIEVINEN